jgi:Putative beta-barrel porin-2, OmpL-like. bbp2
MSVECDNPEEERTMNGGKMRTRTDGIWLAAIVVGLGALTISTTVRAEGGLTLEERVERLERRAEMPPPAAQPYDDSSLQARLDALEGHIKNLPFGIKLGGMVVTSYMYDLNSPDSRQASLRSFDKDSNSFSLDLFQLEVSREKGDNGVGFVTKLNFGKTAERMAADWDGDGTIGNVAEEQNSVELEEAYIMYSFPGLPDMEIKAGKFVTLHGAEVIESPLNYNISRSLAFSFAIPFTHTGVMAAYTLNKGDGDPIVTFHGGIVNGWDNVIDSNDGKSFHGGVMLTPVDMFSLSVGGMYGPEQPNRGDSNRGLIDVVANVEPVENLNFSLNYDYGNETDLGPAKDTTVEWNAFSGIVAYKLADVFPMPLLMALRGEYFDDSDGTRLNPTPVVLVGPYQNAWEVTTTVGVELAEGLMFRTEYRYDAARNALFARELHGTGNVQDDQHTVAAELSYVF